ncbi:hypothetical protein [Mycolicibacterium sp. 120270]|nr:hypothetical protein [Mycolicibacterium sp. 120270]MDX1884448.1 hypothetical protein [Mycolicibacterium sp. 120270]
MSQCKPARTSSTTFLTAATTKAGAKGKSAAVQLFGLDPAMAR